MRELEESNNELRSKLVQSPERLNTEIASLEQQNDERAESILKYENMIDSINQQLRVLNTHADEELRFCKEQFDMIHIESEKVDAAQREHDRLLMQVDTKRAANNALIQKVGSICSVYIPSISTHYVFIGATNGNALRESSRRTPVRAQSPPRQHRALERVG